MKRSETFVESLRGVNLRALISLSVSLTCENLGALISLSVSLTGVNLGRWSHLGFVGRNATILSCQRNFYGAVAEITKKKL